MTDALEMSRLGVRRNIARQLVRSRETGILAAMAIMVIGLSFFAPDFATSNNLLNDSRNFSFVGILVLGQAVVMITGGIDLSVGQRLGSDGCGLCRDDEWRHGADSRLFPPVFWPC